MAEEVPEERTEVFLGMTRPPLIMGIPFQWVGLSFGGTFVFFLLTKTLFAYLLYPVLHLVGLALTRRDANFMNLFLTKMRLCRRLPNARFWKANSYEP